MVRIIDSAENEEALREAVDAFRNAKKAAALTGAGVSVESGIADFRSKNGLWSKFSMEEYGGLEVFLRDPAKAWKLYRFMGRMLEDKKPNPAHEALARLEEAGRLECVITQNVDSLHQAAGSKNVIEMHGDHHNLQCLGCGNIVPVTAGHLEDGPVPVCEKCGNPMKPNVVLFSEPVRGTERIMETLDGCGALLVVGTSAQVAPASTLPAAVKSAGGLVFEFNMEETVLTNGGGVLSIFGMTAGVKSDYLLKGPAGTTLPMFAEKVLEN